MTRRMACRIVMAVLTVHLYFFPLLGVAKDADDTNVLVRAWLIEPLFFDTFVDQGMMLPEAPVLLMLGDGTFSLARVAANCFPPVTIPWASQAKLQYCADRHADARRLGLTTSFATINASGRWERHESGSIRFTIIATGDTPDYFLNSLGAVHN